MIANNVQNHVLDWNLIHCSGTLANSIKIIHFVCLHIVFPFTMLLEQQFIQVMHNGKD